MSKNAIRKYCSAFASKRKEKLRMETWNHLVGQNEKFFLKGWQNVKERLGYYKDMVWLRMRAILKN